MPSNINETGYSRCCDFKEKDAVARSNPDLHYNKGIVSLFVLLCLLLSFIACVFNF